MTQAHQKESYEQLLKIMQDATNQVTVGARYYHYKDKQHTYVIVKVALREEDNEPCVIYESEYMPGTVWIRPLASWLEEVKVDGRKVKRFTKV